MSQLIGYWDMDNMKLLNFRIVMMCGLILTAVLPAAEAYYQEVGVQAPELFQAAIEVLGEDNILKADPEALEIQTDWFEDKTTRKNRTLIVKTNKEFLRRTKYKITMKSWPRYTEVTIRATLQFKTADGAKMAPWRSLKPQRQDIEQEGTLFHKILDRVTYKRTHAA